ncbi:hypothetical protein FGO68_gene16374 [Halteria grandinella]|uniref:Uncharacterized protein n=1 Tax=Halteria grandinella TaxID=5974 RepID=A0A8J8SWI5_HALGN|nr:hypothetical protein FGO68_gene16374 [Halteria grandinella]
MELLKQGVKLIDFLAVLRIAALNLFDRTIKLHEVMHLFIFLDCIQHLIGQPYSLACGRCWCTLLIRHAGGTAHSILDKAAGSFVGHGSG